MDEFTVFINQLVDKRFGSDDDIEPEVMDELRKDAASMAHDYINVAILDHLPESKLDEFNLLLDGDDDEATQRFIAKNIPNIDQVVGEGLVTFAKKYLGR